MPSQSIKKLITKLNTDEIKLCAFPSGILEINLKQLELNILELTKFANRQQKTKFLFPIKANAYGHGMIPLAKFIEAKKLCDYFGVANCQEALELRENKIKTPILILGQTINDSKSLKYIIKNNIEQAISDETLLFSLEKEAKKINKTAKIHLLVDTGMGRGGVLTENTPKLLEKIKLCKNIKLVGVMTHFSVADETNPEALNHTRQQIEKFKKLKNLINQNFPNENIIFHSANSAGTLNYSTQLFDMIRPGIATYGYPEKKTILKLKPILELKSKIILLKKYPKAYSLGYGRTYETKKTNEIIGIVPVGYGDGLSRALSNKFNPIINGKKRKCVGRISMDQFSVLVDKNSKINDEVVIIGNQNKTAITAHDLAKLANTISYEVLCNLGNSKRLRHRYIY